MLSPARRGRRASKEATVPPDQLEIKARKARPEQVLGFGVELTITTPTTIRTMWCFTMVQAMLRLLPIHTILRMKVTHIGKLLHEKEKPARKEKPVVAVVEAIRLITIPCGLTTLGIMPM